MNLLSVIKYEGNNSTFIWKHPCEDFNTGTQLIVHESQEAIFFMNGQALDSFQAGRYTLSSQNIPLLKKFFNLPTEGETPFHCEVYFINKTEQMAVKWGTSSKCEYVEPTYNFPIQLGAHGEMALRVEDARKLLIKIVGTQREPLTQENIVSKFRSFLTIRLKPYLVSFIQENKINIFRIDEKLAEISVFLHQTLFNDFMEYGISLERFFLTEIIKPEEDANYKRFKQLHFRQYADIADAQIRQLVGVIEQQTQAKRMVIEADALATKRKLEGYTYRDERGFDVAERVASNQAVGEFTNMGIGMGMIAGVGGPVGNSVGGIMQEALGKTLSPHKSLSPDSVESGAACPKCGRKVPVNSKFCLECGEKIPQKDNEFMCPQCGKNVPNGKFCLECGIQLTLKCPKCNEELPYGSKFCLECGEKIIK